MHVVWSVKGESQGHDKKSRGSWWAVAAGVRLKYVLN